MHFLILTTFYIFATVLSTVQSTGVQPAAQEADTGGAPYRGRRLSETLADRDKRKSETRPSKPAFTKEDEKEEKRLPEYKMTIDPITGKKRYWFPAMPRSESGIFDETGTCVPPNLDFVALSRKQQIRWHTYAKHCLTAFKDVSQRYEIVGKLGNGDYGIVWKAVDRTNPNRAYAIKCMANTLLALLEARHLRDASQFSPRIVKFYSTFGYIEDMEGKPKRPIGCIVQEYLRGVNLDDVMLNAIAADPDRLLTSHDHAREHFTQAMLAVEVLHKMGMVHRDLKLDNFIRNSHTGEIKMIDLGLATYVDSKVVSMQSKEPLEYPLGWDTDRLYMQGYDPILAVKTLPLPPNNPFSADAYAMGTAFRQEFTGELPVDIGKAEALKGQSRLNLDCVVYRRMGGAGVDIPNARMAWDFYQTTRLPQEIRPSISDMLLHIWFEPDATRRRKRYSSWTPRFLPPVCEFDADGVPHAIYSETTPAVMPAPSAQPIVKAPLPKDVNDKFQGSTTGRSGLKKHFKPEVASLKTVPDGPMTVVVSKVQASTSHNREALPNSLSSRGSTAREGFAPAVGTDVKPIDGTQHQALIQELSSHLIKRPQGDDVSHQLLQPGRTTGPSVSTYPPRYFATMGRKTGVYHLNDLIRDHGTDPKVHSQAPTAPIAIPLQPKTGDTFSVSDPTPVSQTMTTEKALKKTMSSRFSVFSGPFKGRNKVGPSQTLETIPPPSKSTSEGEKDVDLTDRMLFLQRQRESRTVQPTVPQHQGQPAVPERNPLYLARPQAPFPNPMTTNAGQHRGGNNRR